MCSEVTQGESIQNIANEPRVGRTIKDWQKNRKHLQSHSMSVDDKKGQKIKKTLKKPKCELLDSAFWLWFEEGTPLSGTIIKEKRIIFYNEMGGDNEKFIGSEGWLYRWKICIFIIFNKELSADLAASIEFVPRFENIVKEHKLTPQQVYNIELSNLQDVPYKNSGCTK